MSVHLIYANGERYTLPKRFWNSKRAFKITTPIAVIRFLIVNNKNQHLNWEYTFDMKNVATHFVNTNDVITDLEYKFHLYSTEDGLLQATSFEYLNGQKNEFE